MKKILHRFISVLLVSGLCVTNFMSINVSAAVNQSSSNPADELIVKLKSNVTINSVLSKHGGKLNKSVSKLKIHKIKVPKGIRLQTMMSELKNDPSVEYCQPNYEYKASYIPNDPDFSQQWGLTRIKADKAWDTSTGNNSIIIAVIDTGVDKDHPDLIQNLISGYNTIVSSTNTDDDNGHGTHVAGIAAGVIDNSKGISGVSGKSKIMPLKVLNSSGSGWTSDITEAVIWAADHGAKVINMSLGGSSYDQAFQDAINYAFNKGVLVVAAAGNSNTSAPSYPAAFSNVMAVSAIDQNNSRAYFSNYGSYVDITAPGVNIYSTVYNNSYTTMSGTSMACPFVAGAAAFLWSMKNSLTPSQVESILEGSAVDLGYKGKDANFGYGLVDLYQAVQSLPSQPDNPVSSPGITPAPTVLPSYTPAPTPDLVPIGNIDNPTDSETISGQYDIKGWFLDGDGISKLEVIVDNNITGNAVYGDLRTDIGIKYPLYNNNNSGFHYSLDTTKLTAGSHKLTIRETSRSGSQKTLPEITVNVSNKPRAATINYFLSENSTVTIEILDSSGKLIKTLESGSPKQAGWNSAKWDGRDLQGKIVPDGVYTYKITAVDYVGHSTTNKGTIIVERLTPSITSVSDAPDPFIPKNDGVNTIDFTISEDALVTVKIYNNKGTSVKTPVNQSLKMGVNKVTWDGTDDSGAAVPNGKYSYTIDAQDAFKKSAQQVSGSIDVGTTSLVISENTVSPDPFTPSGSNSATISYNLSGSAKVSITVFDGANNLIKALESDVQKSQGANSVSWDGTDSSGMIVKDGIYGYKISAVEEGGLEASPATGIINIAGARENPLISSVDDTPDPFKPDGKNVSTISFNLIENASVGMRIFSSGGAIVKNIPAVAFNPGINSFRWDGKDTSGKIVPGGNYSYIVDAVGIGNAKKQQVSGTITVDLVIPAISDASISPDPFDPAADNTAVLSYRLSENAKVGIEIYDSSNTLVQTLESGTDKKQGLNTANWDGKDSSGNIVTDGSYSYKITAVDYVGQEAVPVTGLFSVSGQNTPLLTDVSDSPDPYKPGGNNKSSINFTLSEEAAVVINISDGNGSFVKNILNDITGAGQNTVTWDGKDEAGKLAGSGTYSYTIDAENMNGSKSQVVTGTIQVDTTPLTITGNTVNPNPFTPGGTNTAIISYNLSHEAAVSVKIYDSQNVLVKTLEQYTVKTSGANSVKWDGRNLSGTVVPQGNYSYIVTAVNTEIGEAKPVSGTITLLDGGNNNTLTVSGVSDSPDPFIPNGKNVSTISYIISHAANVSINLYNSNGDLIKTLFNGSVQAGNNKVTWDGTDSSNKIAGIGTFTYKINAQDTSGYKAPEVSGTISADYTAPVITFIGFSPNPFFADGKTTETIAYSLSENAAVNVTIADSKGSIIRVLDSKSQKGTGANTSVWDGKDINGSIVPAGPYTVKIEAVNSAGLAAKSVTAVIAVQKSTIISPPLLTSLNDYPDPFKPDGTNVSTIEYTLGSNANVSAAIYNIKNELVKTLWSGSMEKGAKKLTWDGRNTGGTLVSKGIYVYKVNAADLHNNRAYGLGTITVEYDLPRVIISGISPDPFESLGSNNATISYILTKEAFVTTEIFDSSEKPVKKLETGVNKLSGVTSVLWDGKDSSGLLVKDGTYTVKITAVDLLNQTVAATGVITVLHTTPEITLVKDSPDPFKPGVVVNTIEFTLTKDAAVTVKILDSNKNILRTLAKSEMKAGINSVTWDGRDASNNFAAGGIYTYTIDAADSAGNKAMQATGTITVDITPPVISNTRVNRLPFTPDGTNAVTVLYELSEEAMVNVKVYDSSNTLI